MNTIIDSKILREVRQHLESSYPYEACGFFLGFEKNHQRMITKSIGIDNKSTGNLRRHFAIDALDYLRVERFALKEDLKLLGIYHSHPDHPAVPSAKDLEFAQAYFSYFIFSIHSGKLADTRSYKLLDNKFIEEHFSVLELNKNEINIKHSTFNINR